MVTLGSSAALTAGANRATHLSLQIRPVGSYLGLGLRDIDSTRAKTLGLPELEGVEIVAVEEGESADLAGIRPGDVMLSYNGEKLVSAQQLMRLVAETPRGRKLRVVCWRAKEKRELWVTTGQRRGTLLSDSSFGSRLHASDVPYPVMIWRNAVIGIDSEELNEQFAQVSGVKQGILVWQVSIGSIAARAGLRAGDVVTGLCGRNISTPRDLSALLDQSQNECRTPAVTLVRDHRPMSLVIPLGSQQ